MCTHELAKLGLSSDDTKLVTESLTVRNMATDYPVVLELLKAKVSPKHLKACFEFLVARGNVPGDVPLLVEFGKSCQDQQTQKLFLDQLKSNGNTQQVLTVLTELSKAGTKGGDVAGCITALKLRGGNPQDLYK